MTSSIVGMAAELSRQKKVQDDNAIIDVLPIVARYTRNSSQVISTGVTTIVNYDVQEFDTRSAVTTGAAWKFTTPVGGYYLVAARMQFTGASSWSDGEQLALSLYLNGALKAGLWLNEMLGTGAASDISAQGSTIVHLDKGDYIDIRVYQTSGTNQGIVAASAQNHVSIARITP